MLCFITITKYIGWEIKKFKLLGLHLQMFPLGMEYYFIHMAATADLTVPHSSRPIFVHFF